VLPFVVILFRHQIGANDLVAGDMSAPLSPLNYSGNYNKSRLLNIISIVHNMALSSCKQRLDFV